MPEIPIFPIPAPPTPGKTLEVAPGVHWLSTSLPGRPQTINLWLLRDEGGWTMVDCGFPMPVVRKQIEAAWSATLGSMPVTRLIVTHHHPDHVGNCRWICERWRLNPTMTGEEHAMATTVMGPGWTEWSRRRGAYWQHHGLPDEAVSEFNSQRSRHRDHYLPLPDSWRRIKDGDPISIGDCSWQVIVAQGHSPEQALLYSRQRGVLISGDQILPRTTPNVSIHEDTSSNAVALFLESNRRISSLCADPLVLPSHNLPFFGLQARIATLDRLRQERLAKIEDQLKPEPHSAAALIPRLFGNLRNGEIGFAMGEVLAQLQYLVEAGRAQRISRDGKFYFVRAAKAL